MNQTKNEQENELVQVPMPENLYKAICINSERNNRSTSDSINRYLELYFDMPEAMLENVKDCIDKSLEGLRENNPTVLIKFSIRPDLRERLAKQCAIENISETEYICKAAVEATTLTRVECRLF